MVFDQIGYSAYSCNLMLDVNTSCGCELRIQFDGSFMPVGPLPPTSLPASSPPSPPSSPSPSQPFSPPSLSSSPPSPPSLHPIPAPLFPR